MLKLVFTDRTLTTDFVGPAVSEKDALIMIKDMLKNGKYFLTEIHEVSDEEA